MAISQEEINELNQNLDFLCFVPSWVFDSSEFATEKTRLEKWNEEERPFWSEPMTEDEIKARASIDALRKHSRRLEDVASQLDTLATTLEDRLYD